jgi:hypothetical protein
VRLPRLAIAIAIALTASGCTSSDVTIAPPRVNQGGRAVAVSVAQSDQKRIVVATESGGLFRTFDGGVSFQHLDGFPTIYAVDVFISSLDPNTIIATARDDFRTTSGGGIWRSTDGGATWTRPGGWPPPQSGTCSRPGAGGISHIPLTRTFHIATDCGLAVSNDNGATFSTTALDPANPKLFAVLVTSRTTGVAADNRRLWFMQGGQWLPALGGPDAGSVFTPHAFASPSWADPNIFYHAGRDRVLWVSTTSGGAWRLMPTKADCLLTPLPKQCGNRETFVRVGRGLDGDDTHLDVYYGDGTDLWRQAVTVVAPAGSNAWFQPDHLDHSDPADLAFTPGFTQPLMLATDGGVHLTKDNGKNWTLTGSNYGGFTALQIGEVTGRQVGGSKPHLDLYYSTQDNDIKASDDGGATWKGSICCEGAFLRADGANPAHVDAPVTGRRCGDCKHFVVPPHVGQQGNPPGFRNAPNGSPASPAGPPFQLIGQTYLQEVPNPDTNPASGDYFLTEDQGASWAPAFSLPSMRIGIAQFAGSLENPVTYVGVQKGIAAGLFRASGVTGQVAVRRADSIGVFALGFLRTGQALYTVFGVDPANPDHLLAHDLFLGMRASGDGGINWYDVPALNTAVTDTGRFRVSSMTQQPFVTSIAWDPTNSCHILIGTMQNGVIRSADGGLTWKRVAGSPVATIVSSFYFPPSGAIWMSTYGRGLWTLGVDRRPPASGRCQFPRPPGNAPPLPDTLIVFSRSGAPRRAFGGLRDSIVCPTCSVVLVHEGWLTDVVADGDVRSVAISAGFIAARSREGGEVPLTIPNTYLVDETAALRRLAGQELTAERKVRGLVLNGTQLVALLVGRDEVPIPPLRAPSIFTRWAVSPNDSTVESRDSVEVFGYQFLAGTASAGATLLFDADTVARDIPVGPDGRFTVRLAIAHPPGHVTVTAVQRDGKRLTQAQSVIPVPGRDGAPR